MPDRTTNLTSTPILYSSDYPSDSLAFGHAAAAGAAIGAFVSFAAVTGTLLLADIDPVTSVGTGAFAALWGGCGLGGMLGASRLAARNGR